MTPAPAALADRLCRVLVGCYPPRWKRRYAEELLDVLDQHHAGRRTVLSLAGGALSTHLDPDYRMEIRLMPRVSRDTWAVVGMAVALPVGLIAIVIGTQIPQVISESSWHLSNSGAVGSVAFSRDQRILVSASGGPAWSATSTLWDVTDQARPRRLSEFEGGNPVTISPDGDTVATSAFGGQPALWNVTRPRYPVREAVLSAGWSGGNGLWGEAFSPDGRILAAASTSEVVLWDVADPARPRLLRILAVAPLQTGNPGNFDVGDGDLVFSANGHVLASVSGSDHVIVWNVTDPARATRMAILTGPRDYFTALAFSPDGNLLAGVTYRGNVRVFRLTGPAGPAGVSTRRGLLARARFAGGQRDPSSPCGPDCPVTAAYALEFTPDGHALMVVINRAEPYPSTSDRDTIFTWPVAGSGALGRLVTFYRNVSDVQPTLAPGDRIVADGSMLNGGVHLWALP